MKKIYILITEGIESDDFEYFYSKISALDKLKTYYKRGWFAELYEANLIKWTGYNRFYS